MLKDLGIDKLYVIRCNYQHIFLEHSALWGELSHLAVLAGLASFLAPSGYRNLIAGSSAPYDTLTIPWGSQPITDHLLSQRQFRVYPDGHGFSRKRRKNLKAGPSACPASGYAGKIPSRAAKTAAIVKNANAPS